MKETDLELYRWKWHNTTLESRKKKYLGRGILNYSNFWLEYGAFASIMPRLSGKTTMLLKMASMLYKESEDNVLFLTHSSYQKHYLEKIRNHPYTFCTNCNDNILIGKRFEDCHLMIDEFSRIYKFDLDKWLNHNWKSVTMVSSL